MSITDSDSNLATTWTEQTTVAFTSGTLATIASCLAYVEGKIRRGTLSNSTTPTSTEVQNELIRAKGELCEVMGFTWQRRYAYADTVASAFRYALPPDFAGGRFALRDLTSDFSPAFLDSHRYDLKFPDPSAEDEDSPDGFTIKGNELWLIPPPDAVYRLELDYDRSGDDNTTTDFAYIPQALRFKCCDFAIFQAFRSLHMWQEAALYKQDWMEGLLKAKRSDSKKRWAACGYRGMSWAAEYSDRLNQKTQT